jgi:hypothetical protein
MRRVLLKETKELLLKLKDNFNTNFWNDVGLFYEKL